ncbi:hypothetical protein V2A85_24780, partial [Yersinia sp. 1252 StPb PI]|uniref:hypothetical protein n=1 Tax=Yersinia sp. 1252 StPb PI TaxID=3117404 RepID=UPI003B284ED9
LLSKINAEINKFKLAQNRINEIENNFIYEVDSLEMLTDKMKANSSIKVNIGIDVNKEMEDWYPINFNKIKLTSLNTLLKNK